MAHPARSLEEKHRGLTALILCRTAKEASEQTEIPEKTLNSWRQRDPALYNKLREDLEPQLVKRIAADAEMIVQRLADKELALIDALDPTELSAKDVAGALRNVTTAKALNLDKVSSPLRERPSHVQHSTDIGDVVSKLGQILGMNLQEPITDAHVVDDPSSSTSVDPSLALASESGHLNARDRSVSSQA